MPGPYGPGRSGEGNEPVTYLVVTGPVPVRAELVGVEQREGVGGVLDHPAPPAVAVVPSPDPFPVETLELRGEDGVGVAADRRLARVEAYVPEVVKAGEQVGLREHADAGDKGGADVLGAALHHAVEAAQPVPVGGGCVRSVEGVEDRPVVFIHEDDNLATGGAVKTAEDAQ